MASEAPPKTQGDKAKTQNRVLLARGKDWQRWVDAEDIRLAESTVDEHGMRNIEFVKDDKESYNRQQMRGYERMGYKVEDKGYYFICSIPDEVYRKTIEKAQHDRGNVQFSRHKPTKTNDGLESSFEDSHESVSSSDI
jgi:hypothetical protein